MNILTISLTITLKSIFYYFTVLGILLKTMGLPEESILASEIVFKRSVSNYDRAATYSMRADAYSLMGEVDTALQFYNKALELAYYQINLYLPLTECYKEVGTFSKEDWQVMLTKIETDVKKAKSSGYVTEAVKQDLENSYLLPPGTIIGQTVSNDVNWAMHNAAEKGKNAFGRFSSAVQFSCLLYTFFALTPLQLTYISYTFNRYLICFLL